MKDDKARIQTIGFIHSGLESYFITCDRPAKDTTRISKSREIHTSSDISNFGTTVLPALYLVWMAKKTVKKVKNALHYSSRH